MELDTIIESSQTPSCSIQAIGRDTVHRICSGQVVLSLAIAVKELVENALDAGATIIDIQLKEYGSEVIEVSDNASGVKKEHFQALTLKHYTSKIRQFDDLSSLATLGFRGEALSSLCALSDLTILTKHADEENASRIKYDRNGKIISENISAREQGTTVTLENLFSTLPVRRKEFLKNIKREFNKMCQLLSAYCLVSKGVKFSCSNTTSKGNKTQVVSTDGLKSVRDNIINVFGTRQISSLIEVDVVKPDDQIAGEYGLELSEEEKLPFSFELFISSVLHGSGRSTTDRQFFYVNSRPCEPSKIIKLVNEVYRQYNSNQHPFVFLNIISHSCLVDVNVTPDKRQVFLEKEKLLLASIKTSLTEAFKCFPSTFKLQNVELSQGNIKEFLDGREKRGIKRSLTEGSLKKGSIMEKFKKRSKTEEDSRSVTIDNFLTRANSENSDESLKKLVNDTKSREDPKPEISRNKKIENDEAFEKLANDTKSREDPKPEISRNKKFENDESLKKLVNDICEDSKSEIFEYRNEGSTNKKIENEKIQQDNNEFFEEIVEERTIICPTKKGAEKLILSKEIKIQEINKNEVKPQDLDVSIDIITVDKSKRRSLLWNITLNDIKAALEKNTKNVEQNEDVKVRFRSKIDPHANKSAEEELKRHISKEDFRRMTIIGQFNLGFIIAKLDRDLFIVDQHASDEKYNFEDLQANTVLENQVLVNPKPLQLTAGNESLLIENEEIFRKNGFSFKIDETAPCTKKILLASVPISKNVIFGKDDIDEILFMLQESSHVMYRPSRIQAMFASRACRKSIMVGKALSKNDMRKIIDHMGEMDQPWNCPHGRPTMRHLINLDLIHEEL